MVGKKLSQKAPLYILRFSSEMPGAGASVTNPMPAKIYQIRTPARMAIQMANPLFLSKRIPIMPNIKAARTNKKTEYLKEVPCGVLQPPRKRKNIAMAEINRAAANLPKLMSINLLIINFSNLFVVEFTLLVSGPVWFKLS